jgi:hypothetical protein
VAVSIGSISHPMPSDGTMLFAFISACVPDSAASALEGFAVSRAPREPHITVRIILTQIRLLTKKGAGGFKPPAQGFAAPGHSGIGDGNRGSCDSAAKVTVALWRWTLRPKRFVNQNLRVDLERSFERDNLSA